LGETEVKQSDFTRIKA